MYELDRFRARGDDGNVYLITVYEKTSSESDEAKSQKDHLRYLTESGLKVKKYANGRFQIFSTRVMLTRL